MRIACIGDSCTFGQNVRADQAWPHLLWQATGHDVRNLGLNGDTTRLALERWHRDIELFQPNLVIAQFGHNDVNLWDQRPRVSMAAFKANLGEMRARSPRLIILNPHRAAEPKDYSYNNRLLLWSGLRELPEVDLLQDGYGVHPSIKGHRVYADYVKELL